jgi:hypothetical protein
MLRADEDTGSALVVQQYRGPVQHVTPHVVQYGRWRSKGYYSYELVDVE